MTTSTEFDKQTSLGVKAAFPQALNSIGFIAESIAKDICAQLSQEVLAIVPQVADYTCTICMWAPIYHLHEPGMRARGC